MSKVVVDRVTSWWDRRQFMNLPWELYKDDPNWVPPLIGNQKQLLGWKHHPFHENAEVQTFIARRDGRPVGRIAAILNHAHNRYYREQRGFFGFFESINDLDVATALFDAVRAWFAERDIHQLRGPANPSMNHECGLLIEGFDRPPVFMMTYNPPYYADLVEANGYRKTQDLHAYLGHIRQLPEVRERLVPMIEVAREYSKVKIRPLDTSRFMEEVELFLEMYNRSLISMWGFVPIPKGEIKEMANGLKFLLVPELALAAEADGQMVGVVLALPDYNPLIKRINGRLFPFGFMTLLRNKKRAKLIRIVSINVIPEYQRWGVGLVLMGDLAPKAQELGIEEAEFSWVSEENTMARKGLEKGGAFRYKTYRMYDNPPPAEKTAAK